ncbi:MAG: TIGR02281 family clan AA aspartic protease [Gammaproteobacteria bacterium]|nr:TIGR02281 family clan AA aspartic protease [Gammaproteobacteria bacterium]
MTNRSRWFLLLMFFGQNLFAAESVQVVGMFPGKVVLLIDGQQYIIKQGQSAQGVSYIRPVANDVMLEINGERSNYKMGMAVSLDFKKSATQSKTIYADSRGMFQTTGTINGRAVRFLVDTGATAVAMSSEQAKKLNIRYRLTGKPTTTQTASGVAQAYVVKLKSVKVGDISQSDVLAVVIEGAYPTDALLGMSFLKQLKVEKSGNTMLLQTR